MEPQELFDANGKSAGVWYCRSCRHINRDREFVESCCICSICKKPFDRSDSYTTVHQSCWSNDRRKRELERLEKAQIVEQGPGPWYSIDGFGRDGYIFDDIEEVLYEEVENDDDWPEWVLCCELIEPNWLDVSDIVERFASDMYEDAYGDVFVPHSLSAAVKDFNKANASMVSYSPDWGRKVKVPGSRE